MLDEKVVIKLVELIGACLIMFGAGFILNFNFWLSLVVVLALALAGLVLKIRNE